VLHRHSTVDAHTDSAAVAAHQREHEEKADGCELSHFVCELITFSAQTSQSDDRALVTSVAFVECEGLVYCWVMIVNRNDVEARASAANARWADALAHSWDRLGQVLRGQRDPLSPDVEDRLERCAKKIVYMAVKSQKPLDVLVQRGLFVVTEEGGKQTTYTSVAAEVVAKLLARAGLSSVQSPTFIALPAAQMSVTHAGLTASSELAAHVWLFPEPRSFESAFVGRANPRRTSTYKPCQWCLNFTDQWGDVCGAASFASTPMRSSA
jgi:hypothetical protein